MRLLKRFVAMAVDAPLQGSYSIQTKQTQNSNLFASIFENNTHQIRVDLDRSCPQPAVLQHATNAADSHALTQAAHDTPRHNDVLHRLQRTTTITRFRGSAIACVRFSHLRGFGYQRTSEERSLFASSSRSLSLFSLCAAGGRPCCCICVFGRSNFEISSNTPPPPKCPFLFAVHLKHHGAPQNAIIPHNAPLSSGSLHVLENNYPHPQR